MAPLAQFIAHTAASLMHPSLLNGAIDRIIDCMSAYASHLVANAFIYKALHTGVPLDHMKLQKLVFFFHAWGLALDGHTKVSNPPEAWPYGPVFSEIYHSLKHHGAQSIRSYIPILNPANGEWTPLIPNLQDRIFWDLLERVWERYSSFSALQLSDLTHEAGSPWYTARTQNDTTMNDEIIRKYYHDKLQQ